jgi:hypothetical protein
MTADDEKQLPEETDPSQCEVENANLPPTSTQGTVVDGAEARLPELQITKNNTIIMDERITKTGTPQGEGGKPTRQGPTGPRTELGKKRSSQNALKFGIFSKATLLKGESRSEYQSLLEGLWKTWEPKGKHEELLVEKLASIIWRYRRYLVAEGAEIRKCSRFLEFDRRRKEQNEAEEISQRQQPRSAIDLALEPVGLIWGIQNPDVLKRCIELLKELLRCMTDDGFNEDEDVSVLKSIYGDPDRPHLRRTLQDTYLCLLDVSRLTEEERSAEDLATPEQCKLTFLRVLRAEIGRLKQYQKELEYMESERRNVEILRQSVPDSPGLDRLLSYEARLERAYDRTLTQLERAQRIRKGQPLPPQLDVKIS